MPQMRVLLSRRLRAGSPYISWLQYAQILIRCCIVAGLYGYVSYESMQKLVRGGGLTKYLVLFSGLADNFAQIGVVL